MMSGERHTAVHEAGHAVIGRVLRLPCGHATIVPDERDASAGHTLTGAPLAVWEHWVDNCGILHREMPAAYRARIISYMAGAEAEVAILGLCNGGDGDDQRQIAYMADDIMDTFSEEWSRWQKRLRRQTARLVRKHREKIDRVATALAERRTLQPDEIDALLA